MDKRVTKTRHLIYSAFAVVLKQKGYAKMTVEDILKESGVSRSTFYTHFRTKEDVLSSISQGIFEHVFSHSLTVEETHDFSKSSIFEYSHLLTHIFYHLHDEKDLITAILASNSKDAFLHDMRSHVIPIVERLIADKMIRPIGVPEALLRQKVCEDFILTVVYWFENDCVESPEKIKDYFFSMNT